MPLFKFHSGAYKAVHPGKAIKGILVPNADMTPVSENWLLVLDGVSGVPPPCKPEDFSSALCQEFEDTLTKRFAAQSTQLFDSQLARLYGDGNAKQQADSWLKNSFAFSLNKVSARGSTTVAAATLIGSKLTYLVVGDCKVFVFRYEHDMDRRV